MVEAAVPAHTKAITKDVVIVKDIVEHLDWIVEKRGMDRSSVSVKIYIDSGEGSCKVLATVMDANHDPEIMDMRVEQPGNRLTRSTGYCNWLMLSRSKRATITLEGFLSYSTSRTLGLKCVVISRLSILFLACLVMGKNMHVLFAMVSAP